MKNQQEIFESRPKDLLEPQHIECEHIPRFFEENHLQAWRYISLTLSFTPNFNKPIMACSGLYNTHPIVFLAGKLWNAITEIQCTLEQDQEADILNSSTLMALYNMLASFIPEMKQVLRVFCNPNRYNCIAQKESDMARKRALTLQIRASHECSICNKQLISTMHPNSSFSTNCIIIFSRSSPKDPMDTLAKECA